MKYEMLIMIGIIRKALKNRTFFLHLGVVQKKSACCQESPNSACCRYSHSEGWYQSSNCCDLVGSVSGIVLLLWVADIQPVHLYC